MIDRPPEYQMVCHCGMKITGTNEKGLISLLAKHYETGEYHIAYELADADRLSKNKAARTYSQQEILIKKIMLSREKKAMPTPEGVISTSTGPVEPVADKPKEGTKDAKQD